MSSITLPKGAAAPRRAALSKAGPARRASLDTPRLLAIGLVGVAGSVALFWGVGALVLADARQGVQTIGRDTAPSVVAAQEIRARLANMDADVAGAALTRGPAREQAWRDYASQQAALSDNLVTAARNITYGEAERGPIAAIATGMQVHAGEVGAARALMGEAGLPEASLARIRSANDAVNTLLLPAASALNDANETVLEATWSRRKAAFAAETLAMFAAGVPALGTLVWLQLFLSARTRRTLNPALLAATLVMAGAAAWAGLGAGASAAALTSAKQDAFDSVRALWKTRAIAYSAHADESYFLLDASRKQAYADAFHGKLLQMTEETFAGASSRRDYLSRVAAFESQGCHGDSPRFGGLLGTELLNVTFEGECAAAAEAYRTLADDLDIDARLRALDGAGQKDAAITLDVGLRPGEGNHAFGRFDKTLDRLLTINQSAFDDSIATADRHLAPLWWVIGAGGALAALLTVLGLRPRLNEYRT